MTNTQRAKDRKDQTNAGNPIFQRTVVQFTPLPIEADSRTFKQAASLARAGYRSIVVEGSRSVAPPIAGFELHSPPVASATMEGGIVTGEGDTKTVQGKRSILSQIVLWFRFFGLNSVVDFLLYLLFRFRFRKNHSALESLESIPRPDIVILHSYVNYPFARKLADKNNSVFIYDAHDAYAEIAPEQKISRLDRRWVRPYFERLERRCINSADLFMTVGDGVANIIEKRFGRKPVVVQNVHDLRLDTSPRLSIRQILGIKQNDFLLVAVGNYKEGTSVEPLLQALEKIDLHVHLAFLGNGFEIIRSIISSSPISSRVHFLRPVPPDQVVPFIRDANASIILYYAITPNFENALPNRFFQSIAAELPLIYPDLSEMRRLMKTAGSGIIVNSRDPDQLLEAVRRLVDSVEDYAKWKIKAVSAAKLFTWENEENKFLDYIERAVTKLEQKT